MKKIYTLLSVVLFFGVFTKSVAQVTTNGASGLAPAYASLASAINDLNSIGTVTAPVEIYAGGDETAPAGGYVITATGTAANTILIEGGGYILTAGVQAAGSTNDAVIKIVGGDYITLQNFIINENPANTIANVNATASGASAGTTINVSSTAGLVAGMGVFVSSGTGQFAAGTTIASVVNATQFTVSSAPSLALALGATIVAQPLSTNVMTEFGIALYGATTSNGAKNNIIQGHNITLNTTYTQSIGILSSSTFSSATTTLGAAPLAQTAIAGGENSDNGYYSNTISAASFGIMIVSPPGTATFKETGNIIGGAADYLGNTITYGNNTPILVNYPGCQTSANTDRFGGIIVTNSVSVTVQYNIISSSLFFTSIASTGITVNATTAPTGFSFTNTVTDNTVTVSSSAAAGTLPIFGIDFGYGLNSAPNLSTLVASGNTLVLNQTTASATTTAGIGGVKANYASGTTTVTSNTMTINQTHAFAGNVSSGLTGIWASGVAIGAANLSSNNITFNQVHQTTTATSVTSAINGILIGAAAVTVTTANLNNNNITVKQSLASSGTFGAGNIFYINAAGVAVGTQTTYTTLNINNNNLNTLGSTIRYTGTTYGINHDFTNPSALTISTDTITIDRTGLGATYGTFASAYATAAASPTSTITSNRVTMTGTITGSTTFVALNELEGNSTLVKNITSNSINLTLPTVNAGIQTGIGFQTGSAGSSTTTTGSIASNNIVIATGGATVTGVLVSGGAVGVVTNINANTFNISSTSNSAALVVRGVNIGGGTKSNIFSNNFTSLAAPGATTASIRITAIELSAGSNAANPHAVYSNTISNAFTFPGTGNISVEGIYVAGVVADVYKNKIYGLTNSSTGTGTSSVYGIRVNGLAATTTNIYNNIIGFDNSTCPNANSVDAIRGINIVAAPATCTFNVIHNTIYLSAVPSATVTNFGTTGVYHTYNATATSGRLNLINNIIVNKSTPKGTGLTVALRRSASTSLANYGDGTGVGTNNCNNNLFYSGTPGTANLIFYDGTNSDLTINAFKTRMLNFRETNSVTEDPVFASLVGSNAAFLHFTAGTATLVEAGGKAFTAPPSFTDDFDGNTRCPGVGCPGSAGAPDIGADEFAGTCIPPSTLPTAYSVGAYGVPTPGNYTGTFTAASPAPTGGYLIVRTPTNTQPSPVNGTTYVVGNTIGAGTVVGVGVSTTFADPIASGSYYYWVFAYNACSGSPSYSTTALVWATSACTAPTAQPTSMVVNPLSTSSISGSFTAVPAGGASGYLVVRTSSNSAPDVNPANGTTYSVGNTFGTTVIGTVVSVGTGTTFTATGLTPNTPYWFWVYAYNNLCYAPLPAYNVTSPLSGTATTFPCVQPLPAINTVGPTATYPTVTAAIANLISCSPLAASANYVFELQSDYVSTSETFPLTFPNTITGTYTSIIFRPAAAATALNISSSSTTGTLLFQGGSKISFDGRQGGTGSSQLTIQNLNVGSSYAVQFENGSATDTIRYCNIRSVHNGTSGGGGTINFAQAGAAGNTNIVIENNNIYDATGGTPTNAIYSSGSSAALPNSGIKISNNNIYNFFNAAYTTAGINLAGFSTSWTINGNSFYQTANRTFTSTTANFNAILSSATSNFGLTIQDNNIGGTATALGGSDMTILGNGVLRAIQLTTGTTSATNLTNNTISKIAYTSSNSSSQHSLINLLAGLINVGPAVAGTPNVLGGASGTNSVKVVLSDNTAGVAFAAIASAGTVALDNFTIRNNTIGSIAVTGTSTAATVQGISLAGSTAINTVIGNTIGIVGTNGSFSSGLNTTITGILGSSSNVAATQTISGNTIVNMTASNSGSNTYANGIYVGNTGIYTVGDNTYGGNTIYNINSAGTNLLNYNASGIVSFTSTAGQSISRNTIHSLSATSGSADVGVVGIYYASTATGATNNVERNFIHSLSLVTGTTSSYITGIQVDGSGATNIQNNMIRLGIKNDASSIVNAYNIFGIAEYAGTNKMYMNSVYIGGSNVGSGSDSYAYYGVNTGTKDVRNNIFWNARSNASASTPNHFATVLLNNTGTIDYNDILATGTNGKILGFYGSNSYLTLAAWRTATSRDANSYSSLPRYLNPTAGTPDLHIDGTQYTVVEGGGTAVGPANDYDNDTRASFTPVDLGADALTAVVPTRVDLGITGMTVPASGFACYSSGELVTVTLRNYSATLIDFGITPVTITVQITGAVTTTRTITPTGTLAGGASFTYASAVPLNMSAYGTYDFACTFTVGGTSVDADFTNDEYFTSRTSAALSIGTATSSPSSFCGVASGTPTVSLNSVSGGAIQWYSSTTSNTGPWTPVGTNSLSYSPGVIATTHWYYATVTCGASTLTSNVATTIVSSPTVTSASVSGSASSCGPASFSLIGAVSAGSNLKWYDAATGGVLVGSGSPFATTTLNRTTTYYARAESIAGAPATATFGTGTSVNATTGYPAPYTNWYGGTKHQMLILASELSAAGVTAGNLTSVTFYVSSVGSTFSGTLTDFSIYMGTTTNNALTSTFEPAATLVYSNPSEAIPSSGPVTHTFTTAFNWDGSSNIIIQTSYSNGNFGGIDDNVQMFYTPTTFLSTNYHRRDLQTPATILAAATGNGTFDPGTPTVNRPNMTIGHTAGCTSASTPVTMTINPVPSAISIAPTSATICPGVSGSDKASLVATGGVVQLKNSVSVTNSTSLTVPDYNSDPTHAGASNTVTVAGIPAGATIDSVRVQINSTYSWDSDLMLFLKSPAPNGKVINLVSNQGGSGDNFTNTVISSNNANIPLVSGAPPFNGLFRADAASVCCANTPGTGNFQVAPNASIAPITTTFSDLWNAPAILGNGTWTLYAIDDEAAISGTVNNWTITVYYTEAAIASTYSWSPAAGLFTDAALTDSYIAQNITTVYAAPSSNQTYTITATNGSCTSTQTAAVTVNALSTSATSLSASPTSGCSGLNVTLSQTGGTLGTGATWKWYTDAAYTTPVGGIAGAGASATATVNPALTTTYYLRAEGGTSPCTANVPSAGSVTVTINPVNTWLGVNSNWADPVNWCPGIPTAATNVTIPTSGVYPNLAGTDAICNNLTITGSGNINVSTGRLSIGGTITSPNNAINATTGTIVFSGTGPQTINADQFSTATIANMIDSNTNVSGLAIFNGTMLKVTGTLGFGNVNNSLLTTNDKLTLLSDATATARIGDITNTGANSGNNISGKVVIERYVPGNRKWRLLTSPIRSTTTPTPTISAHWQEGGQSLTLGALSDPNPTYGTHISKGYPIVPATGYDQNNTGNSSIFYLTPTGWNGTPSATNGTTIGANNGVITDQPGYLVFVRGNRATDLSLGQYAPTSPTKLRSTGLINTTPNDAAPSVIAGTGAWVTGGFTYNLWANPYPSAISYHSLATSGGNNGIIPDAFYLWDANITGTSGVGGWVSLIWNSTNSNYDRTVVSGIGTTSADNTGNIQSGAAFMVRYTGNINFRERNKVGGSNNLLLRPSASNVKQLRANLLAKNADGSLSINDGMLVTFNEANNNGFDDNDMPKMATFAENLGILSNGITMAIERRKPVCVNDTIQLQISKIKTKNYKLEFALDGINTQPGITAELEDMFTNTRHSLNMQDSTWYDFSAVSNSPSADANRFRIVFKKLINYTGINANVVNDDVVVDWKVASEFNIHHYEVERSANGTSFESLGNQPAVNNSEASKSYSWVDLYPATGTYYYRIKCIGSNGAFAYSDVAKVTLVKRSPAMFVFPNPVTDNIIGLQMNKMPAGVYEVRILTEDGKVVDKERIAHAGGTATEKVVPSSMLVNGNYKLEVIGPDKSRTVLKVIVMTK